MSTEKLPDWHALETDALLQELNAGPDGLSSTDADSRLTSVGPNRLPEPARPSLLLRFLAQFHNVLIYALLVAGVAAGLLGHVADAAVITAVVVINAAIGFIQEGKAEQAMAAIGKMLALKARVRRNGKWQEVSAETLVPGDLVRIKAGDRIPADLRLLEAHGLRVDQAALTGESLSVSKQPGQLAGPTDLADRNNMAYSGTMATNGTATGLVVVTGAGTQLGRISHMLESVETLTTPLLRRINRFARTLTVLILIIAVAMVMIGALLHSLSLSDGMLAAIALIVAAIPEGLPAIISITLAIGVRQMAGRQAIIRRLPAVETLGSVNVICSDKTGTLTMNELKARMVALVDGPVSPEQEALTGPAAEALLRAAILCNDSEPDGKDGDPLERALLELADAHGADIAALREQYPRLSVIPFSSDLKLMASGHRDLLVVKGAPERILEHCQHQLDQHGTRALDREFWHQQLDTLTSSGLRVLALAQASLDDCSANLDPEKHIQNLTLLGLVGFADPPRPEVPEAIRACQSAGIRIKMITGDHVATARSVARELEIGKGTVNSMTGQDLDQLDDEELKRRIVQTDVFARTTPEHKLRLVKALQANGQVVAMTGDGANDAPALKRADIGVAMGIKGTEASRQAAEMVLADDNFATIVAGVEEGRGVYDNIRKAVLFILPTNSAEALVILLAVLAGLTLPITPVQILWVNMVTAVTLALALAFEPLEQDVLRRPPRPINQGLLSSFVIFRVTWVALLLTAGTFYLHNQVMMATGDATLASTMALNVLVAGELVYLFNCRRWQQFSLTPGILFANPWAWAMAAVLIVLQLGLTYFPPAQAIFGTASLGLDAWWSIAQFAVLVFVLVELEKFITRRSGLAWASPGGQ